MGATKKVAVTKKPAMKVVEDDTASSEELVDEVMAVLSVMTEDERCEVFAAIAETYDLETGEELDEEDGDGDESDPDEDDEDEDDEDEDEDVDEDVE